MYKLLLFFKRLLKPNQFCLIAPSTIVWKKGEYKTYVTLTKIPAVSVTNKNELIATNGRTLVCNCHAFLKETNSKQIFVNVSFNVEDLLAKPLKTNSWFELAVGLLLLLILITCQNMFLQPGSFYTQASVKIMEAFALFIIAEEFAIAKIRKSKDAADRFNKSTISTPPTFRRHAKK
mgnify:FL=1